MTATAFGLVLFAALLHASWNSVVKAAGDKGAATSLIAGTAGLLAAMLLPVLPQPDAASWPFIAASAVLQVVYFLLVAWTYQVADLSRAYPLMRGVAPLLVSAASLLMPGERLPSAAWAGIGLICLGVLTMARPGGARGSSGDLGGGTRGTGMALATAVVIAAYTLIDGTGVRLSGAPASYTLWVFLLTGLPLTAWALARQRRGFLAHARENWRFGLIGGAGTVTSYGLALWAMTFAPVALVSALRETSILFAMAMSRFLLGERFGPSRVVSGCLIACGAVALRLA